MRFKAKTVCLSAAALLLLSACSHQQQTSEPQNSTKQQTNATETPKTKPANPTNDNNNAQKGTDKQKPDQQQSNEDKTKSTNDPAEKPKQNSDQNPPAEKNNKSDSNSSIQNDHIQVVSNPDSITVLVNKHFALPDHFNPPNLVYPNVPFIFSQKNERRMMQKEAADALEQLFAGAKKDGITLLGVSAYRSYTTQEAVFNQYVAQDGYEKARTYSALPGTSEHETGLAIDVTGGDGKCAAQDCFGGTKEAGWLAQHAPEYGFIIRYLKGKEQITGYEYEPWHIRYVGKKVAQSIASQNSTLEEYLNAVPVSK